MYSTPMVGPNATLLESPMSEDPPTIGLGMHGATYSHAAQSHVRSASMSSARLQAATLGPQMGHSPLGLVGTASPRPESGTGMWSVAGGGSGIPTSSTGKPLGSPYDPSGGAGATPVGYEAHVLGGAGQPQTPDRGDTSMNSSPDREQPGGGWQEHGEYFNVPAAGSRW
jgi:hypothetical protein